jgi:hypothetical protein
VGAKAGTPEGDRLDVLAAPIDAYEATHFPFDPPDPIEAIKSRMEQMGLTRKGSGTIYRIACPRRGNSQSQAQPLDRHDPALE